MKKTFFFAPLFVGLTFALSFATTTAHAQGGSIVVPKSENSKPQPIYLTNKSASFHEKIEYKHAHFSMALIDAEANGFIHPANTKAAFRKKFEGFAQKVIRMQDFGTAAVIPSILIPNHHYASHVSKNHFFLSELYGPKFPYDVFIESFLGNVHYSVLSRKKLDSTSILIDQIRISVVLSYPGNSASKRVGFEIHDPSQIQLIQHSDGSIKAGLNNSAARFIKNSIAEITDQYALTPTISTSVELIGEAGAKNISISEEFKTLTSTNPCRHIFNLFNMQI